MSQTFFEREIPLDCRSRVLIKAQLRSDEEVILFVDGGVLRKGAAGIVFTDKGIHKYGFFSHMFFPYAEVKNPLSYSRAGLLQAFCRFISLGWSPPGRHTFSRSPGTFQAAITVHNKHRSGQTD
jgi:hypothetical protein